MANIETIKCFKGNPKTILVLENAIERNPGRTLRRLAADEEESRENFAQCFESSIKSYVVKMIETTKRQAARENNKAITDFYIHTGRTFSNEKSHGVRIISEDFKKNYLRYQRLKTTDLDFANIQSSNGGEFFRYDITVKSKCSSGYRIRYKIFLTREGERLAFMTKENAGVAVQDCFRTRVGNGYFATNIPTVAYLDVIDPRDGLTTRIQSSIYMENPEEEDNLKGHLQNGLSSFFENIEIDPSVINKPDADSHNIKQEINLPEEPQGYHVEYFRRTVRKTYQFDQNNTLSTSQEKVFINNKDPYYRSNSQSDVKDMFFGSSKMNEILKMSNWQELEVLEEIKKMLEFADKTMELCKEDPVE